MNRDDAGRLFPGDQVLIKPLWNQTERPPRRIAAPTEVLAIRRGQRSQTGVLLTVACLGGGTVELDAGWFERVLLRPLL